MRAYSNDACTWTNVERRFSSVKEGGRGGWPGGSSNNGHGPSIDTSRLRSVMNAKQTRFSPLPPPLRSLFFPFFFFFIFMSQEDEEHPVLVKDEGGGTWRISHDFLLSWLRDKKSSNHGICRFVGIFHWKKCPENAISHGQGIFFLDSENSVTPCSPRDGWHWYLCDREIQIFFYLPFFIYFLG